MQENVENLKRNEPINQAAEAGSQSLFDFISKRHRRHREICSIIDHLVTAKSSDMVELERVRMFLEGEFTIHTLEEEEEGSLFYLMRNRCAAEDAIDDTIEHLKKDHDQAHLRAPNVLAAIERVLIEDAVLSEEEKKTMTEFANHLRRHLIFKKAIILPLARLRLTGEDLELLQKGLRLQCRV